MTFFTQREGQLHVEGLALEQIANACGTPCYVYSRAALEAAYRAYDEALAGCDHLICYAVKANSNQEIIKTLFSLGASFDVASYNEFMQVYEYIKNSFGNKMSQSLFPLHFSKTKNLKKMIM